MNKDFTFFVPSPCRLSCVYSFHHSILRRCSQPFVILGVLQQNIVHVWCVDFAHCLEVPSHCKATNCGLVSSHANPVLLTPYAIFFSTFMPSNFHSFEITCLKKCMHYICHFKLSTQSSIGRQSYHKALNSNEQCCPESYSAARDPIMTHR